jgi:3-deoxy-D-manno-octulosonic-acid transferase
LANARLSEKSATGYATFRSVTRRMLAKIDFIGAQSELDARRLVKLGAKAKSVAVTGSLKYHVNTRSEYKENVLLFNELKISERSIVVAASTRAGEEKKLLVTIKSVLDKLPTVLFIVVPRHPERFHTVYSEYEKSGLNCRLRSSNAKLSDDAQVLIGDSLGEMHSYYTVSELAFVGGSLVDTGCHNVLEPAALSLPVLVGPSQYNFSEICGQLEKAGGLLTVRDENELAEKIIELLNDSPRRARMGSASQKEILANQNALPRLIEIIRDEINFPG